ncbi:hypothetical protein MBM_05775 [Drepanopeziza brunnea f. sp. 'multigermtubi' MB_m1]|uniref:Oxidoreductase acuF-like C2H2 type zinc-finger domain-containing protein n=1 Tax=Marssonina brunnea f. sp. multigermtubi (strain MB_m1) TaxID=1072389 RepID=K1XTC4_MARBU|nr:uncharacterized protein MBM_05775 [Drepanopeziza brunnea f. sp. 'multigermtubi' MB_m1]EKD15764.1 hypothetical protein MBM_05775 [Drepanopeziza brunnea f. sp. 'multigermtubi' MB_m1]
MPELPKTGFTVPISKFQKYDAKFADAVLQRVVACWVWGCGCGCDELFEIREIFESVQDAIKNLFRFSIIIRNNTNRDRYAKAAASATANPFNEQFDVHHRKNRWLIERRGKAITQRRQYLKYCREYHDNTARGAEESRHETTGVQPAQLSKQPSARPMPISRSGFSKQPSTLAHTQASTLMLTSGQVLEEDTENTLSQTPYATSNDDQGSGATLSVIKLEHVSKELKQFECPYCWQIQTARTQKAWKRSDAYESHLESRHPENFTKGQLPALLEMRQRALVKMWPTDSPLALFAIPQGYTEEGEADSGNAAPRMEFNSHSVQNSVASWSFSAAKDLRNCEDMLNELAEHEPLLSYFIEPTTLPPFSVWLPGQGNVTVFRLSILEISQRLASDKHRNAEAVWLDIGLMFSVYRCTINALLMSRSECPMRDSILREFDRIWRGTVDHTRTEENDERREAFSESADLVIVDLGPNEPPEISGFPRPSFAQGEAIWTDVDQRPPEDGTGSASTLPHSSIDGTLADRSKMLDTLREEARITGLVSPNTTSVIPLTEAESHFRRRLIREDFNQRWPPSTLWPMERVTDVLESANANEHSPQNDEPALSGSQSHGGTMNTLASDSTNTASRDLAKQLRRYRLPAIQAPEFIDEGIAVSAESNWAIVHQSEPASFVVVLYIFKAKQATETPSSKRTPRVLRRFPRAYIFVALIVAPKPLSSSLMKGAKPTSSDSRHTNRSANDSTLMRFSNLVQSDSYIIRVYMHLSDKDHPNDQGHVSATGLHIQQK